MPLVNAKCTNCGAPLEVDHAKDAAVCSYCGSAFIVEKAINSYNISNNITGSVVNIYGGAKNDFDIQGGVLVKYSGASTDVVIPDTVRKIGEECFANMMISSVIIPDSVTTIGRGAFLGCVSLTSITIPNGITELESDVFSRCTSLKNVIIPDSIKKIGNAFSDCTSITSIIIPNGVEEIYGAFSGCTSLTDITIPDSVRLIGNRIFKGCRSLRKINASACIVEKLLERGYLQGTLLKKTPCEEKPTAEESRRQQEQYWLREGRCPKCGGEYSLFGKCKSCGYRE